MPDCFLSEGFTLAEKEEIVQKMVDDSQSHNSALGSSGCVGKAAIV